MFKDLLKTIAPFLGSVIAGPKGAVLAKTVAGILLPGVKNPSDDELCDALNNASPEQRQMLMELEVEAFKYETQDKQSARQRQISLKDKTPTIIAYVVTAGYFMSLFLLHADSVHISNMSLYTQSVDTLRDVWMMIISFLFGAKAR